MTEDVKKKRIKELSEVTLMISEFSGVKPELVGMGEYTMDFRVMTSRGLTNLVAALYKRPDVDAVELGIAYWQRRRGQVVSVTWAERF